MRTNFPDFLPGSAQWEPCFSLHRPSRHEILYEPDGTLYAVALGTPMTISLHHRERAIRAGDIVVVPPALALEVEPEVDFLAVRWTGIVPDHFRERFIQVWGYDHFPADLEVSRAPAGQEDFRELIPEADLRFPCAVGLWQLAGSEQASAPRQTGYDLDLLLCREGPVRVSVEEIHRPHELDRGHLLGLGPELTYRASGAGQLVVIRLSAAAVFDARRTLDRHRRGGGISPESVPGSSPPVRP